MKPQTSTHLSFRFDPKIREQLDVIKVRDGIPISEQARRAFLLWIETKEREYALLHRPVADRPAGRRA